jgi:RIO-like serine/threonine protein kinase
LVYQRKVYEQLIIEVGLEKGTGVLGAVVYYETFFGKALKFHREGRIMSNAYSKTSQSACNRKNKVIFV